MVKSSDLQDLRTSPVLIWISWIEVYRRRDLLWEKPLLALALSLSRINPWQILVFKEHLFQGVRGIRCTRTLLLSPPKTTGTCRRVVGSETEIAASCPLTHGTFDTQLLDMGGSMHSKCRRELIVVNRDEFKDAVSLSTLAARTWTIFGPVWGELEGGR
ncbi:hypothetical protein EV356DRAFT_517802 [Viridothelium virens]|uniref:Uncharacterized protein n=1 Tax=Viridothelium virens TaxID=1048519 RepID=A0A6A6HK59_VIRVR|nr:hypothetical protein EV356DRAFT_517802 [Viridothelium virens]